MGKQKKYWKGLEELNQDPEFEALKDKEFAEYLPSSEFLGDDKKLEDTSTSRRDFLKFLGFSVTAASLAACETPVTKAIPYVIKPEEVTPGVPNWYASTYADGNDYCSILVKTREGRPIKIEGNKKSGITKGGVNARVNSSVLSLYDSTRIQQPLMDGEPASWEQVDNSIIKELQSIADKGGSIRILTNSMMSPSTKKLINDFAGQFGGSVTDVSEEGEDVSMSAGADVKHVNYDPVSYSGMINANKESFGVAAVPSYRFDKAKTIVSIGADFLGTWLSSIENSVQYGKTRKPDGDWMSKHFQFESNFSLTGTNADVRVPVKPSEQGKVILALYNYIAGKVGQSSAGSVETAYQSQVAKAGDALLSNQGDSLVVAGVNSKAAQVLVNGINSMLGNYGNTIDINNPTPLKQGNDKEVVSLVREMKSGGVDALLVWDVDPVSSLPASLGFEDALAKVKTTVSFAIKENDTSVACKYVCPDNHYLESWNDAKVNNRSYSLAQPVIKELYDTRQMQDSLLKWMGSTQDFHAYIQNYWEKNIFPKAQSAVLFADFWNQSLHDGVAEINPSVSDDGEQLNKPEMVAGFNADVSSAASAVKSVKGGGFEMAFYQKTGIGDGRHADNPWLQELPDPVSKITWDNYLTMAPSDAREMGFNTSYGEQKPATMAKITVNGVSSAVPVIALPGQAKGTVGLALGYGKKVGSMKEPVGINAYPMLALNGDEFDYFAYDVSIENLDKEYPIASTQTHHTVMDRDGIVKETDINTYRNGSKNDYNKQVELATHEGKKPVTEVDLWEGHGVDKRGHRWGMVIDMNTCIGCGSCVTSCNSENNVPVVGKDEVRRAREMHWIRIDRYFSSAEAAKPEDEQSLKALEVPEDNPKVVYQPMMCQHCNHAPCETVCPVAATSHSSEGLNMMAYNRCIGTRYCANNCPYKVRRFNWFNYKGYDKFADFNPAQDDLGRMVLNPDVVVRSRGVMEKCSLCVQRIQAGKLDAKKEGRPVKDGEIQTACASACPTDAITFGDLNDDKTEAHKESQDKRSYRVIEEVGTQPNIYYQVKVRNEDLNEA